jgi:hypothetical protein
MGSASFLALMVFVVVHGQGGVPFIAEDTKGNDNQAQGFI